MIYIVCALHCEAKPIIDFYKLSLDQNAVFPVFGNEKIKLVVAGIGKTATAAAMAYLYARDQEPSYSGWLNIGIAGHKNLPLGTLVNVNKVSDDELQSNWYTARPENLIQQSKSLITVNKPAEAYENDALIDMEASAFMATALRFSWVELVQVLKVISDNQDNHIDNINKQQVQNLIGENLPAIAVTIEWLNSQLELFEEAYQDSGIYEQCLQQWHFSHYQQKQLQRLLQRWLALSGNIEFTVLQSLRNSKQVLEVINQEINRIPVAYYRD